MRLSDIKGEAALDTLADIITPAAVILADSEIQRIFKSEPRLKLVQYILKNHKESIIEIMARLDGKEPEDYEFNLITLPSKLLEILNDPALKDLFTSQGRMSV